MLCLAYGGRRPVFLRLMEAPASLVEQAGTWINISEAESQIDN